MVLSLTLAFASNNGVKAIEVGSDIYNAVKSLYISQHHALPSTTGPWSENEVKLMLSRLQREELTPSEKDTYDYVLSQIQHEDDIFKFNLNANLEVYGHTNPSDFTSRAKWTEDTKPMFEIQTDSWIGDNFYGLFTINIANAKIMAGGDNIDKFGSTALSTNLIMVPPASMKTLDFGFPHNAYIAAGGENWNLMWGKYNLSWGPGKTGNFIIGDHLESHDNIKLTAFNNTFKYTFLIDSFPHPMNYYGTSSSGHVGYNGDLGLSSQNRLEGLKLMLSHRLEWRLFNDVLNIALTEGLMYMDENNMINLSILNPSMLWHNLYTRAHSNSILALEADWSVINGLNIYGSIVVDENLLPGEPVPGKAGETPAEPSAMGYMLGLTYSRPLERGILEVNAEGVFTDPFLYLRDGGFDAPEWNYRTQIKGQYGINYVVALRDIYNTGGGVRYTEEYLGYKYGGDAIVGNVSVDYREYGKWNVGGNFFFMAHGTFDQWTVWTRINPDGNIHHNYPTENPTTPTTSHVTENQRDDNADNRDSVEYTFDITLKGGYKILQNLEAYVSSDFIFVKNLGNISSNALKTDIQLTVGLSYEI